ncbi:hypothetical protein P3L10_031180 [Capsicum annuum]
MEKASLIVFFVVTSLIFSCDIVMGQKCSTILDCPHVCKYGYQVCYKGMCGCCAGHGPKCHHGEHAHDPK